MPKKYGNPAPSSVRKFLQVDFRTVMGIDDEAIHANFQEVIHRKRDNGTSFDLQERLGTSFCQRPKPRAQPSPQYKSGFESSQQMGTHTIFLPIQNRDTYHF